MKVWKIAAERRSSTHVPLAKMFGYATAIRSLSQGRATYTMEFEQYREMPAELAKEIISEAKGT